MGLMVNERGELYNSRDTFDATARYAKESEKMSSVHTTPNRPMSQAPNDRQDRVNHPSHYERYDMETIEAIKGQSTPDEYRGFLKGNVMKYLSRYRGKNGIEDLNKAEWYLHRLQEFEAVQGDDDGD